MRGVVAVVVMLAGCAPSAKATMESMRKAGCDANADAFFSHVDEDVFMEKMRAMAVTLDRGRLDRLPESRREEATLAVKVAAGTEVYKAIGEWREAIAKGADGDICKFTIVESVEGELTGKVHVMTGTGRDKGWVFTRTQGRWLLTNVTSW